MSGTQTNLRVGLLCNVDGNVRLIIRDDWRTAPETSDSVFSMVNQDSTQKAQNFLASVRMQGAAYTWELELARTDLLAKLYFVGCRSGDVISLIRASTRRGGNRLCTEQAEGSRQFMNNFFLAIASTHSCSRYGVEDLKHRYEESSRSNTSF